jgi:hypothetical protein
MSKQHQQSVKQKGPGGELPSFPDSWCAVTADKGEDLYVACHVKNPGFIFLYI